MTFFCSFCYFRRSLIHNLVFCVRQATKNTIRCRIFHFCLRRLSSVDIRQLTKIENIATSTVKTLCVICTKEKSAVRCEGCFQIFCYNHFNDHRQQLSQKMDEIEVSRDSFRQTLTEQIDDPRKHSLIKQIDRWESDSIAKIQQTAKECRESVVQRTNEHFHTVEINLTKLTEQMREVRQENDFNELDLNDLKQKLAKLESELDQIPNISIEQNSSLFISKISVVVSSGPTSFSPPYITSSTRWKQNGVTIAGGNKQGNRLDQLSGPTGIYVDDENQCVYIADCGNHRIVQWKSGVKMGEVVAGGNRRGSQMNQLDGPTNVIVDQKNDSLIICDRGNKRVVRWPRCNGTSGQIIISDIVCYGLAMDNNGDLYVSNNRKHEVRRWKMGEMNGALVAGGYGKGDQLNQLYEPSYLFVDEDHCLYMSDNGNHRVMKWMKDAKEGIVLAGGQGKRDSVTALSFPRGVVVDHLGNVYLADAHNHRIMRWSKGSKEGQIILGGNGRGDELNQFAYPSGLSFDRQGHLYVVDEYNHRVQKFEIDVN